MKKFAFSLLVLPFLLAGTAAAQTSGNDKSNLGKAVTLSGRVNDDGKTVTARNGQSWLVTNPATLTGHEGQQVKIKCQLSAETHNVLILSLKAVAAEARYVVHPSDSAFRR